MMTAQTDQTHDPPIACTLDGGAFGERVAEWETLAQRSLIESTQTATGVRLRFRDEPGVEEELRRLLALEEACCAFLTFDLDSAGAELVLSVRGPAEAAELVGAFLHLTVVQQPRQLHAMGERPPAPADVSAGDPRPSEGPPAGQARPGDPGARRPSAFLLGLASMAVALGLAVLAMQPPSPKPLTAPADEFSAARALAIPARLLDDGAPHPTGTEANARVRARLVDELTALGYPVEIQSTFACRTEWAECGVVDNVLTRLPGQIDGPAVLLTAHYDSVWAGPGAADDVVSVAAIVEVARILRGEAPPRNPVIFLLSDGEEPALLGAEAFVAEHPWAAEVGVVVNLEARGTRGLSNLFETTDDNAWLIAAYAAHAPTPATSSLYDVLVQFVPGNTDLDVYEAAGMPAVNFAFMEELAQYHTPLDSLANVDPGSVQHQGDNALAAVRAFAELDLADPPVAASVYLAVVPGLVLQWPASWTAWVALAGLLVWLGLGADLIRRGELRLRAVLWGSLVLPVALLGAALLGLALAVGVSHLVGAPAPWYAHPEPIRVAVWAGVLLCLGLTATAGSRRAGFWGLGLGVWLWWSVLSLLVAWWSPGASVVFIVPTAVATVALAAVGLTPLRRSPWARALAAAVALLGTSWIWFPGALYAEIGAGRELGLLVTVMAGLAASPLAPLFAPREDEDRGRQGHKWVLRGAAVLMAGAAAAALAVPVYSASRPQRLNVLHVEDRGAGHAYWVLDSRPNLSHSAATDVPASLRHAAPFSHEPAIVLPWSSREYLVASAAPSGAPAPEVQLLADNWDGGERVVRLRLRSPRGGLELALYVPEAAGLTRLAVVGTPYTTAEFRTREGHQVFRCHGPACEGVTLDLHVANREPFAVWIVDSTPGLPRGGEELIRARPDTAVPSSGGDVTLIANRVLLGEP
jgi:hypothetical protein